MWRNSVKTGDTQWNLNYSEFEDRCSSGGVIRASSSFPPDICKSLESMARWKSTAGLGCARQRKEAAVMNLQPLVSMIGENRQESLDSVGTCAGAGRSLPIDKHRKGLRAPAPRPQEISLFFRVAARRPTKPPFGRVIPLPLHLLPHTSPVR